MAAPLETRLIAKYFGSLAQAAPTRRAPAAALAAVRAPDTRKASADGEGFAVDEAVRLLFGDFKATLVARPTDVAAQTPIKSQAMPSSASSRPLPTPRSALGTFRFNPHGMAVQAPGGRLQFAGYSKAAASA